jgi:hypothetical protein
MAGERERVSAREERLTERELATAATLSDAEAKEAAARDAAAVVDVARREVRPCTHTPAP